MKGSPCKIYSETHKKWYDGQIIKVLANEHVTVQYGKDMVKVFHIDSQQIQIAYIANDYQNPPGRKKKGRAIYYSEGMHVDVFSHEYSNWIQGVVKHINKFSNSVDILLDSNRDPQNIGTIHIKGIYEQSRIRPRQLQTRSTKSILKTSNSKRAASRKKASTTRFTKRKTSTQQYKKKAAPKKAAAPKNNWFKPAAPVVSSIDLSDDTSTDRHRHHHKHYDSKEAKRKRKEKRERVKHFNDYKQSDIISKRDMEMLERVARGEQLTIIDPSLSRNHPHNTRPFGGTLSRREYFMQSLEPKPIEKKGPTYSENNDPSSSIFGILRGRRRLPDREIPGHFEETDDNKVHYEWSKSSKSAVSPQKPRRYKPTPAQTAPSPKSSKKSSGSSNGGDSGGIWPFNNMRLPMKSNGKSAISEEAEVNFNNHRRSVAGFPVNSGQLDMSMQTEYVRPRPIKKKKKWPFKPWIVILICICFVTIIGGAIIAIIISKKTKKSTKDTEAPTMAPTEEPSEKSSEEEEEEEEEEVTKAPSAKMAPPLPKSEKPEEAPVPKPEEPGGKPKGGEDEPGGDGGIVCSVESLGLDKGTFEIATAPKEPLTFKGTPPSTWELLMKGRPIGKGEFQAQPDPPAADGKSYCVGSAKGRLFTAGEAEIIQIKVLYDKASPGKANPTFEVDGKPMGLEIKRAARRRLLLNSDSNGAGYLSYGLFSALIFVSMTICLQSAYLHRR